MRAFLVAIRAVVTFYNDLFLLVGMSVLWWLTGGIFVAAVVVLGWPMLEINGPWWLMPLLAIPAGPATAGLANVARRSARELHVNRSFFFDGLRTYWRQALALSAISMGGLSLLLLNLLFYLTRMSGLLQMVAILWLYLIILWMSMQVYLYPVLVGLEEPSVWAALRTSLVLVLANPLFSIILVLLAILLTGISIVLAILLLFAWPALVVLLGEHALKLLVERAQASKPGQGTGS